MGFGVGTRVVDPIRSAMGDVIDIDLLVQPMMVNNDTFIFDTHLVLTQVSVSILFGFRLIQLSPFLVSDSVFGQLSFFGVFDSVRDLNGQQAQNRSKQELIASKMLLGKSHQLSLR